MHPLSMVLLRERETDAILRTLQKNPLRALSKIFLN